MMRSSKLQSRAAVIRFTARKDCFVSLPRSWASFLNDNLELIALRVENGCGQSICTTWSGDFTVQENGSSYSSSDVVEICGFFAAKQGFTNGQLIHVAMISNVTSCETVHVVPSSVEDWEILEMNAQYIENDLLNQVRLISRGQTLPIWIQRKTCVFVVIENTDASCQYGLLNNNTELIISPKTKRSTSSAIQPSVLQKSCYQTVPVNQLNGHSKEPSNASGVKQPYSGSLDENAQSNKLSDFGDCMPMDRLSYSGSLVGYGMSKKAPVFDERIGTAQGSSFISADTIVNSDKSEKVFIDSSQNIYANEKHDDNGNYEDLSNDDDSEDDDLDNHNYNNSNNEASSESSINIFSWIRRSFSAAIAAIHSENEQAAHKRRKRNSGKMVAQDLRYEPEILKTSPVLFTARVLPVEEFLSSEHNYGRNLAIERGDGFCVCLQMGDFSSGEILSYAGDFNVGQNNIDSVSQGGACTNKNSGELTHKAPKLSKSHNIQSCLVRECHISCHVDCHSKCDLRCIIESCNELPCHSADEDMAEESPLYLENPRLAQCRSLCASTCPVWTGHPHRRTIKISESSTSSLEKHSLSRYWTQGAFDLSRQSSTIFVPREAVSQIPCDVRSFFARISRLASPREIEEAGKSKQRLKGSAGKEDISDQEQVAEKQEHEMEHKSMVVRVVVLDYEEDDAGLVHVSEGDRIFKVIRDWEKHVAKGASGDDESAENNDASENDDIGDNINNFTVSDALSPKALKPPIDSTVLQTVPFSHSCFDSIRCKCCRKLRIPSEAFEHMGHLVELGGGLACMERLVPQGHVLVPLSLRDELMLSRSGRVMIKSLETFVEYNLLAQSPVSLYALSDLPEGFTEDLLVTAVRHHLHAYSSVKCPIIINSMQIIHCFLNTQYPMFPLLLNVDITSGAEKSKGEGRVPPYFVIDNRTIASKHLKFVYKGIIKTYPTMSSVEKQLRLPISLQDICLNRALIEPALSHIKFCLSHQSPSIRSPNQSSPLNNGAILLVGPKGVGKTTVAMAICAEASRLHHACVETVDCKTWRGKRPDSIQQKIEKILEELRWRQPAVLLLDDLDEITPPPKGPEEELSSHHTLTAIVLRELIQAELCRQGSKVVVIATAQSRSGLSAAISNARGVHLFSVTIELKTPDEAEREKVLDTLLSRQCGTLLRNTFDVKDIAARTENFVARDLEMIIQRALLRAVSANRGIADNGNTVTLISTDDILAALQDFTPASLRDVPLVTAGTLTWRDVGGLSGVRSTLVETLEWPFLYRSLYAQCPIRMSSGILMYGAPGTGKTLLAAVVAKEFNFNFVSVKGPELLNKYIGASEQAVRNIFQRAQSAKPCILFFDEFDSLAPRRGHDSTGVTDRVVNQLLTQLDGVESLEGVYVLAATSRPDLIDPALLRPGRIDKAIYCPIPSQEERYQILQALGRQMTFAEDVDLCVLSDDQYTGQLTGADLKALLYDAQLFAIHQHQRALVAGGTVRSVLDEDIELDISNLSSPQNLSFDSDDKVVLPPCMIASRNFDENQDLAFPRKEMVAVDSQKFIDRSDIQNHHGSSAIEEQHCGIETKDESGKMSLVQVEITPRRGGIASAKAGEMEARVGEGDENLELKKLDEGISPQAYAVESVTNSKQLERKIVAAASEGIGDGAADIAAALERAILAAEQADATAAAEKGKSGAVIAAAAVVVTWEQLLTAARDLRPSVTPAERKRFELIYEQFVASRSKLQIGQENIGQRATLA